MNEDFLHYVWKYKVFSKVHFKTTNQDDLVIIKPGVHNTNAGPDFLNAHLKIENQTVSFSSIFTVLFVDYGCNLPVARAYFSMLSKIALL